MITYLAAAYGRKQEIRGYRDVLKKLGVDIQSAWLDEPGEYTYQTVEQDPDLGADFARTALHDIMGARRIIVFTGELGRCGNQLEQGFAMALGLKVVIIGPNANLFSLLAHEQYANWADFLQAEFGGETPGEEEDDG